MEIRLLGPLEVRDGEKVVPLPRRQQRALLAALALRAGEVVSRDRLIADLWGERAPASATGSLQNTVAALRKAIGRDTLLTQTPGYRLALGRDAVDANRFERLLREARQAEPVVRARLLEEALGLWRGPALADLDEEEFARREASRLDELRLDAQEERIDADLRLGRHAAVVGELEQLVSAQPLRERFRAQLMLALYRCGRQTEALELYRAARLAFSDERGLDPSPELQELERRILRQDPDLDPPVETSEDEPAAREIAELRLVTVLAATPPAAADPEQHRRLLDETLARVRESLDRHRGSLERFGPEGLVAVFGADGSADDDAIRAVLAARELGLDAGVATGEVVGGTGAVVTRAAELARVGGIRLDERTAALASDERHLDAPLVGRHAELEQLEAAFAAVRTTGRCGVVTVVGEPGIGKTRLARELAFRERDRSTVLVARCIAHGDGATFLPLLGALRRAEPEQALDGEEDAALVLSRLSALAGGEEAASLGESYWAVRRLLEALARRLPVLLVLDDAHWAEPALVDLIDYLAERTDAKLLVVCLARPEVERPLGDKLVLGPLDEAESRAIVAGTAELDDRTIDRIVALAEGNALYVEQLASFAADGGEGLPPTLDAVLAGRLGRLEPSRRAVLQRAAVVGREFSLSAVAALVAGEVAHELLALSRAGFVHPAPSVDAGDDGYTFHHVLLRDAAYATLTKSDRAELHERTAAWIDRDVRGDDAVAGYHLEQAVRYRRELGEDADGLAAVAGERLGEAGMRVWRTNNVTSAVELLTRASALLPAGSARGVLLLESSVALALQGDKARAEHALDTAEADARATSNRVLLARIEAERAGIGLVRGDVELDVAIATLAESAETLRAEADERGLGRTVYLTCLVHALACNNAAQAAAAEEAVTHYAAAGFSPAACQVNYLLALYDGSVDVATAAARCADVLASASDAMTEANAMSVLGALRALAGAAADGLALLDHARPLYDDIGSRRGITFIWTPARIDAEVAAGLLEPAAARAEANVEELRAEGELAYASCRSLILADLHLAMENDSAAEDATAFGEANAFPSDVLAQFLQRSMRARLHARAGNLRKAEGLARKAISIASLTDASRHRAVAHLALADVLERKGDGTAARAEEAVAAELLRRKGVKGVPVGTPST